MLLQQWVELDTIYKFLQRLHFRTGPIPVRHRRRSHERQLIKVGQLEIRYLVDGAEKGGLGVFE